VAAVDFFLNIDGITPAKSKQGIQILSFSWGESSPVPSPGTGTGGGSGKADADTWTFTKQLDADSPQILLASFEGKPIKTVELTGKKTGKGSVTFLDVTLSDCVIVGYQIAGSGDNPPGETFDIAFRKIHFIEFSDEKGNTVKHEMGWDLATNKKA
jgi:type VI secretion system secreted protein Hcp